MTASPLFATRRRPERRTTGGRQAKIAEALGTPLMPWQQQLADVAGEIDEHGRPYYREVVVTVPRQSGKTTVVLSKETDTCLARERATVAYTAQTGHDARKKLLNEQAPMVMDSLLGQLVERIDRTPGGESIRWTNGSRITVQATTEASGHGSVLDDAVIDEAFKDEDDRREQALLPAMITKPHAQLWVVSTQGTAGSTYLNRKCEVGRVAAQEDSGEGICYLEFAAAPSDDPEDPEVWRRCMPALGHTISERNVRHAFQTMSLNEFRRSMLNIQDSSADDAPIPFDLWRLVQDVTATPSGRLVLGVEPSIDQSHTALVVAGAGAVEVVEYDAGTSWVGRRCAELVERHGVEVVVDPRGPARAILNQLAAHDVEYRELTSSEVAGAAVSCVTAVADHLVSVRPSQPLDMAVRDARRRWSGDQWFWTRKGVGSDVSPLVAMSNALLVAQGPVAPVEVKRPARMVVL